MCVRRLTPLFAAFALLASVAVSAADTATVSGVSRIYLRTGPATTYAANGIVAEGEAVTTLEAVGNWHRVQTADGRTGFLYSGYLTMGAPAGGTPSAAPPSPAAVDPGGAETTTASPLGAEPTDRASSEAASSEAESFQEELARLKSEVSRLRADVGRGAAIEGEPAPAAALTLPTRVPVEISPNAAEASNLRTAGVAAFFLVVGWIFGAGFARRRTRSQRGRLRF